LDAVSPEQKKVFQKAQVMFENVAYVVGGIGTAILFVPCGYCQVLGGSQIVIGLLLGGVGRVFDTLASDPPDPNFTEIASPVIRRFPLVPPRPGLALDVRVRITRLAQAVLDVKAHAQALLTSVERSQGAAEASNNSWQAQQLRAGATFARRTAATLRRVVRTARDLRLIFTRPPQATRRIGTVEIRSATQGVIDHGLSPAARQVVKKLLRAPVPAQEIQTLMVAARKAARSTSLRFAYVGFTDPKVAETLTMLEALAQRLDEQASQLS
jgi:hypothetical protein